MRTSVPSQEGDPVLVELFPFLVFLILDVGEVELIFWFCHGLSLDAQGLSLCFDGMGLRFPTS